MATNMEILEETRVEDAVAWMRTYLKNHPKWVPNLEQLAKISDRFKITEGKVLVLYDRVSEERDIDRKIEQVIYLIENQYEFGFNILD